MDKARKHYWDTQSANAKTSADNAANMDKMTDKLYMNTKTGSLKERIAMFIIIYKETGRQAKAFGPYESERVAIRAAHKQARADGLTILRKRVSHFFRAYDDNGNIAVFTIKQVQTL